MTKTKQATKSVKPAPVELHDEALDRVAGGATQTKHQGGANFLFGDGSVRLVT